MCINRFWEIDLYEAGTDVMETDCLKAAYEDQVYFRIVGLSSAAVFLPFLVKSSQSYSRIVKKVSEPELHQIT